MTTYGGSRLADWKTITQAVARELKGEPNNHLSNRIELRWGRRGSFQLTTDGPTEGRWKDWESGQGGRGAVSLAGYLLGTDRDGALDWLRRRGYLSDHPPAAAPRKLTATPAVEQASTDRSAIARSIWASSAAIPRHEVHPARRWFSNRRLWRPELPTPPFLRWRAADNRQHTVTGVAVGTATITVTAADGNGNRVSDAFEVVVVKKYAALIAQMYEWRNDPTRASKAHTDLWDRALLAFGETVADAAMTAMTAAEAQTYADRGWERWAPVAKALAEIEAGGSG